MKTQTLLMLMLAAALASCSKDPELTQRERDRDDEDAATISDAADSPDLGFGEDGGADAGADAADMWTPPENCTATHESGLPVPSGRYCVGVGSEVYIDRDRSDPITGSPEREVVIHYYYPTYTSEGDPYVPFDRDSWEALGFEGNNTDFVGNAIRRAPPAQTNETFPLLIFMPGFTAPVGAFSSWLEHLASHGWVVAGIEHPGISTTRYPDGTVVTVLRPATQAETVEYLDTHFHVVVDDALAVRDVLARNGLPDFVGRGDLDRVGYFGQSYGGATALAACELDPNCVASLNIDGVLFQGAPAPVFETLTKPWGVMLSEGRFAAATTDDPLLVQMRATTPAPTFYAEFARVGHLGMSDVNLVFAAIGQARPDNPQLGTLNHLDLYDGITTITQTHFEAHFGDGTAPTVADVATDFAFVTFGE